MRAWVIAGALMVTFINSSSYAEDMLSAGYMLPRCKAALLDLPIATRENTSKVFDQLIKGTDCLGRVLGIAHFSPYIDVCFTKNVMPLQMTAVIVKHIDANPFTWNLNFFLVAEAALKEAWPCKR